MPGSYQWSELCSSAVDVLVQNRGIITCFANIFSNLGAFYCAFGRCFRRLGDLTRHRQFSGATNMSAILELCYHSTPYSG